MKALVLGGTRFVGLHLVEHLQRAGHDVTLCNRGRSNTDLFPDLPRIHGDRDGDMSGIGNTTWDVVYDVSGYEPAHVERVAEQLDGAPTYVFISTVSVYSDTTGPGPLTEDSPVFESGEGYGELKALAEAVVRRRFSRHHIVRPGIIAGPSDPTDRLTYWVSRFAESGAHIVPEAVDSPLQYIDVRDLAEWLVALGSDAISGTYNAVAPPTTLDRFLREVERVSGSDVERVPLSEDAMREHGVEPWRDLPMWFPPSDTTVSAFFNIDGAAAGSRGLTHRAPADTIRAILDWADHQHLRETPRVGLSAAREAELIRSLRHRVEQQ